MQRSFIVALLVGLFGPVMDTYLVHRRFAMLGDGVGHASPTGVVLGWLAGIPMNAASQDSRALPGAMIVFVLGAITIELIRQSDHASTDVALVVLLYGGVIGGVLLIGLVGGTSVQLNSYLLGPIATVTQDDILVISTLSVFILLVGVSIIPALSSVTNGEDFARSTGLPVRGPSMVIAIPSVLTVAIAMRVVGSLLTPALTVALVTIAQFSTRSFMATVVRSMAYGALICTADLSFIYFMDLPLGAPIVVLAVGIYTLGFAVRIITGAKRRATCMRQVGVSVEHPELAYHNEPVERV